MSLLLTALNIFGPSISKSLEKFVPDTEKRDEIEREIKLALLEQGSEFNKQAGDIILAEAKSEHWITATWRPLADDDYRLYCRLELCFHTSLSRLRA